MSREEIEDGLASLGTEHPFKRALFAFLEESVEEEQGSTAQPDLTDGGRHFNAGRLAHAIDLRERLKDYVERGAKRIEAKREDKG